MQHVNDNFILLERLLEACNESQKATIVNKHALQIKFRKFDIHLCTFGNMNGEYHCLFPARNKTDRMAVKRTALDIISHQVHFSSY